MNVELLSEKSVLIEARCFYKKNRHASFMFLFGCRKFSSDFNVIVGDGTRKILTEITVGCQIEAINSLHVLAGVKKSSCNYAGKISNLESSQPEIGLGIINLINFG